MKRKDGWRMKAVNRQPVGMEVRAHCIKCKLPVDAWAHAKLVRGGNVLGYAVSCLNCEHTFDQPKGVEHG